jgi:PAS domain S-box-containing protein
VTTHRHTETRPFPEPVITRELVAHISLAGEIMWASSALSDVLGWDLADVIGHNVREFGAREDDSITSWNSERLNAHDPFDARLVLRHRDGGSRECRATFYPMRDPERGVDSVFVTMRGFTSASLLANPIPELDLYQILAENISDVVSMTEGNGNIAWVSPSIETLLGWPANDVIGHTFSEYMYREDLPILETALARILGGETVQFEVRLVHRDGEIRWTAIASHLVELPGRDRARIAVWRDVHDAVQARNSLVQSRRDFQRVAENASDVVIQTDIHGKIEWVSPAVTTVLGWRAIDVQGKNVLELIAAVDAARVDAWRSLVLTGEKVRSAQMRYRTSTSESRWMAVRAQPLIENHVAQGVIMSLRDCHNEVITSRALNTLSAASRALTRSDNEQELLNTMCQAAVNEGGYLLCWYARPSAEGSQQFLSAASSLEHRLYVASSSLGWGDGPEGRNPAGAAWRSGQTIVVNDRFNDSRFSEPDPEARSRGFRATIALPVRCARQLDGVLIVEAPEVGAFDVSVASVLEELAAQIGFGIQRLRDRDRLLHSLSEQLLLSAAVTQAGESIAITDPHGNMVYVNPALVHSSGYDADELIGQNPRIFQSGLQNRAYYEAMWQQLTTGSTWRGVLVNKRKNGDLYEEEATISPVHDENGRLTAYVAVKRDLTVERHLQADLTSDGHDRMTILELMREMRPVSSLEAMANLFCRLVTRLDGIDSSAFLILHHDDTLSVMGEHGSAVFGASPAQFYPASLVAEQVYEGHPAAIVDLDNEKWDEYDQLREAVRATGVRGVVVSPLRWNDTTIGVLVLATHDASTASHLSRRLAAFDQLGTYAGSYFGAQLESQRHRESLHSQIREILDQRAFTPVFQPFVELATGRVVGYEALTRFSNGRRPDLCIIDAHKVGLGPELESACAMASIEASRDLDPELWLSLNFSPAALLGHYVEPVLAATDRQIVIEITEHDPIENYAALRNIVASLPHCQLAVDDAGAGFTSLSHILELRPAYVKLDISIIRDIDTNPARQAMTAGMCHFAAQTNTIVIAEGVETQAEADTLIRLGVSLGQDAHMLGQGYFYGRPGLLE